MAARARLGAIRASAAARPEAFVATISASTGSSRRATARGRATQLAEHHAVNAQAAARRSPRAVCSRATTTTGVPACSSAPASRPPTPPGPRIATFTAPSLSPLAFAVMSPDDQRAHGARRAARGPRSRAVGSRSRSRRAGAATSSSPPRRTAEAADAAIRGLQDRGSPSHDGMAARLVGYRADERRHRDRAAAAALGPAAGRRRRVRQRRGAVRHALGRRALAGRAARELGRIVGGALGARRRRRGRPGREPGRHARARAAARSGRCRPSACAARR